MFIDLKKRKSDYIIGKIINKSAYFLSENPTRSYRERNHVPVESFYAAATRHSGLN